ncbi:PulJ/GspJ family protein [Engelhardtia mirabilis]|uniref:Pseudopilin GspJ n=1 Tax=Engelhardtia mirabilis TaxID=2528011 RepID=A0A518BQ36_9BACT|nr:hypothetical protein Pla133_41860 [Planctomycetes bacterium Pla133]QDV03397.1 hypothetical protein Pla86_41850 [Planctomycetes bacterium Pla86]
MAAPLASAARRGLTLVELVLALGLFAVLSVALVQVLDATLSIWQDAERGRERMEVETSVAEWLLRDLDYLAGGSDGDLLYDWAMFDVDGDGIANRPLPRLRLVRRASAEDLLRLGLRTPLDEAGEVGAAPRGATPLVEVVWCLVPIDRPEGALADGALRLLRGERLLGDQSSASFFDRTFFAGNGYPRTDQLELVAAGVLDWRLLFAGQTTVLRDGWKAGDDLRDAAICWDARNLQRPDAERSPQNRAWPGMPSYDGDPLLPRRMRFEFEFERPDDARRRTSLASSVAADDLELDVMEPDHLPNDGELVLLGEEWMRVKASNGSRVSVERGQRGTRPVPHKAGEQLRFSRTFVREVLVPMHREDWSL